MYHSSGVDITAKFNIQNNQLNNANQFKSDSSNDLISEFNAIASDITSRIQSASNSIDEIGMNISNSSKINTVCGQVKQDLDEVSSQIAYLDKNYIQKNKNNIHMTNIYKHLQLRLADVTNALKKALEYRANSLEKQTSRRQKFTTAGGQKYMNILPEEQSINMPNSLDLEMSYQTQRTNAVTNINKVINELSIMFEKMAGLVASQDESISRIDAHLDDSLSHIESGQIELMRYFQSISSHRQLILKIFGIIFIFIILWGFFK